MPNSSILGTLTSVVDLPNGSWAMSSCGAGEYSEIGRFAPPSSLPRPPAKGSPQQGAVPIALTLRRSEIWKGARLGAGRGI